MFHLLGTDGVVVEKRNLALHPGLSIVTYTITDVCSENANSFTKANQSVSTFSEQIHVCISNETLTPSEPCHQITQ
jgi:hypothetical protein